MSKLTTIKTRVTESEREKLEELARVDERSLASLLRKWIREKLSKEVGQ